MDPVELAFDAQAGFVAMENFRGRQDRLDLHFKPGEVVDGRSLGVLGGLFGDIMAEDVVAELADALGSDEMLITQIGEEAKKTLPVLHWSRDVGREGSGHVDVAGKAVFGLRTKLSDFKFLGRQVEDLAMNFADQGLILEIGPAAIGTDVKRDCDDMVGMFHGLQGVAGMPRLATRLSACGGPETFRRGFGVAVGRRRLAAVAAIESQTDLYGLEAALKIEYQVNEAAGLALGDDLEVLTVPDSRVFHENLRSVDRDGHL